MRTTRLVVALCCCAALGVAGVTAVAAPPPSQLCGVCGPGTANDAEISGATGQGTLDIYVDEAGDSRWHARVPVTESAAERYRTNATALEAAVDDAWARYHAAAGDVRDVEPTLEGDAVVVNYTVDDVAERGVGDTWLLDYFKTGTSLTRYEIVAERVTIHTPDGTTITNRVSDADVDGNAATWTGDEFDDQTYVTYGSGGVLDTARGYATIGLEIGPTALYHGVSGGIVPGLLIAGTGIAIGRLDWGSAAFDARELERMIVAVGAVGAGGFLVVGAASSGGGFAPGAVALASLGVGYALFGSAARRLGDRFGTREFAGLSVLATMAAVGLTLLLVGPPVYPFPPLFGLATALCLPIGHATERGRTPIGLVVVAALTPIAAVATVAPVSVFGFGPAVFGLLLLPWVVSVAIFGYPLALLGRRLAVDDE
ncbi:hypothetical protein [Natrinema salsiterrestre]|uniref:Uncharacterized protein n=1 Tax=Natrinema salsiterrestre TaxID=2950540 RepID=A0A9Q4KXJ9_9EURY|nr:hypothetical protein [Natrinema salsiterrestre]MDF9745238.1 hypothetical protein [Natrinema salsiterrestre]